jgi:hypothetical protein
VGIYVAKLGLRQWLNGLRPPYRNLISELLKTPRFTIFPMRHNTPFQRAVHMATLPDQEVDGRGWKLGCVFKDRKTLLRFGSSPLLLHLDFTAHGRYSLTSRPTNRLRLISRHYGTSDPVRCLAYPPNSGCCDHHLCSVRLPFTDQLPDANCETACSCSARK